MRELSLDRVDVPSVVSEALDYFEAVTGQFNSADVAHAAAVVASNEAESARDAGDETAAFAKSCAAGELIAATRRYLDAGIRALDPHPKGWKQITEFFRRSAECSLAILDEYAGAEPNAERARRLAGQAHGLCSTALTLAAERLMAEHASTPRDATRKKGVLLQISRLLRRAG